MNFSHSVRLILISSVVVLALAGCSGSSDDINSNDSTNLAPVADAGPDQLVEEGVLVFLDGSSSIDEDGRIVSYSWSQNRGASVPLNNANTVTASFIAPRTGFREHLDFLLTVQDDKGAQHSDTVTITVNVLPIADAGKDQTFVLNNPSTETVTLAGIFSDSDGAVIAHQWVQTGGPAVVLNDYDNPIASFTVTATTAAYTFSYTVTDNDGAQSTDYVSVYVARIIFSDSFSDENGLQGRWKPFDNTAILGEWGVIGGRLLQNITVESVNSFVTGKSYHLGTYALLDDFYINGINSYRFSVDVTPLTNTTGVEGNDVGIMFRYQNESNYYRVALNARFGFTRFEKRTGGQFETLAVNSIGYVNGQPMHLTAEVNGDTIIVWIDGELVFAVVDNTIPGGSVALYCQDIAAFDNVLITEKPLQPLVALSKPLAYSVALTRDEGDELVVEAIVLNKPDGGSVWFSLNDGPETSADEWWVNVYGLEFEGVSNGNHDVTAILRNVDGKEVSHDINSMVGVGGDYIVTVGDSITNGIGDLDPSNNSSFDGRIIARQGFQAPLADLLTNATGRPQIVFNEGIGGDRASNLETRIDSIMERHPGANKVLLMIGTNDARDPPIDPTVFRGQVQGIIEKINGRQVWLAKPMPTFNQDTSDLNNSRNSYIQQYNAEIDWIVASNPDAFSGPNFYIDFSGRSDLYFDHLHPNDAGYVFMADRWHDVLVQ